MADEFSIWTPLADRLNIKEIAYPGIYAIAISKTDISGESFTWIPEIVYIGMTNAKNGLRGRLSQFNKTIQGGNVHGGGQRFRFKHPEYKKLIRRLYVSVRPFRCDVTSENPSDLKIMGDVAKYEYECFALFAEKFGHLPEFNDKKRSPKK